MKQLTNLEEWRPIPRARRAAAADSDPAVVVGGSDPAGEESDGTADLGADEKVSASAGITHLMRRRRPSWLRREDRRTPVSRRRAVVFTRQAFEGECHAAAVLRRKRWRRCRWRIMAAAALKLSN